MARITGAFDEITVEVMARAYQEVCNRLPSTAGQDRELAAKRILGTAALGERDMGKMCDDAVAYLKAEPD